MVKQAQAAAILIAFAVATSIVPVAAADAKAERKVASGYARSVLSPFTRAASVARQFHGPRAKPVIGLAP